VAVGTLGIDRESALGGRLGVAGPAEVQEDDAPHAPGEGVVRQQPQCGGARLERLFVAALVRQAEREQGVGRAVVWVLGKRPRSSRSARSVRPAEISLRAVSA